MATKFELCEKGNVKFRGVTGEICIEDAKLLYKCAKKYKGGVYVETGSYLGLSATLISAGIGDGKIYCHDLWVDSEDWDKILVDSCSEDISNEKKATEDFFPSSEIFFAA